MPEGFARAASFADGSLPASNVRDHRGGARQTRLTKPRERALRAHDWRAARMTARAVILARLDEWAAHAGMSASAAAAAFATLYNSGQIEIDGGARQLEPQVSRATLMRWRSTALAGELAPRWGNRGGTSVFDVRPDFRELAIAIIAKQPLHVRAPRIREALAAKFPGDPMIPCLRTVERFVEQWKSTNATVLEAIANPDGYRSHRRVAFGAPGASITRLNQEWQIDGTPADVMLAGGRHHVMVVVDVYSRRMMALVTRTARAEAAARLVRKAIGAWGVPELVHGDNGAEFRAAHFQRALHDLGIQYEASPPFQPQTKPFVERAIGTLMRDLFEQLPGFIGHSVAERKAIEGRRSFAARLGRQNETIEIRMTPADLQRTLDDWCAHVYASRPHAGLAERTPAAVAAAYDGEIRRIDASGRALDLLLGEGVIRVVGKKGIKVDGAVFIAPELGAIVGETVRVFVDDDGARSFVYLENPRTFFCIARNADGLTGAERIAMAMDAKRVQTAEINSRKREIRALHRLARGTQLLNLTIQRAKADAPILASQASEISYRTAAVVAAEIAAKAVARVEGGAPPPDEHPDRYEIDAEYAALDRPRAAYDESAEAEATVARYRAIVMRPRATWSADDADFVEMAAALPEIKALGRMRHVA